MAAFLFTATHALSRLEVEPKGEQSYGSFAPVRIIFGSRIDGGRRARSGSFPQVLQNPDRIGADRFGNGQEFNNIKPAFAALIFGDEGLGLFQAPSEVGLRQAYRLARLDHQRAKGGLIGRMD